MKKAPGVFIVLIVAVLIPGFASNNYKDDAMTLFFAGQNAYNQGNYEEAELYLAKALETDSTIEAKTPNAKFMLGVSAFKNQHYNVAKVNLSLYTENPIAQDLLLKIEEIEKNMGTGFYYYSQQSIEPPAEETTLTATRADTKETEKQLPIPLIITVVFVGVTGIMVFLELKFAIFSRLAVRLVLVKNPVQVSLNSSDNETTVTNPAIPGVDETELLLLSDTPFEEKIDIRKMATAEIEEISRFFSAESTEVGEAVAPDSLFSETEPLSADGKTEEEISQLVKNEILDSTRTELPITADDEANTYDHVEDWDDLSLQDVLKLGEKILRESETGEADQAEEGTKWKSIDEFTQEAERDLDYFEDKNEVEEDDLARYFDLFFSREKEKVRSN
jgi:hypothetical protein